MGMKVKDIIVLGWLGVGFYTFYLTINGWTVSRGALFGILTWVLIGVVGLLVAYPVQYYLKNQEIETLIREEEWFQKVALGFPILSIIVWFFGK